jgi:hypothetical protein
MTRGISKKEQRSDQRRKRNQIAAELAWGAKEPPKAIPVPTKPKRAPARQSVSPWGRREK